jgi:RhtB (resistance to homoserine/threonine) family protein
MHTFLVSFLTVASLQFLALISPGPDFAMVTRNALLYPRREAIYTALGITLGLTIHISYCVLGFAFVLTHSLFFFNMLKYLGAAYLIYIGLKSFLPQAPSSDESRKNTPIISTFQAMRQGFLCNLLNPKASLFFIGLFTLVIKPNTPLWQQSIYGVWMIFITFAWFSFLACFITRPLTRKRIQKIQPIAIKILGGLLILMGCILLLTAVTPSS